MTKNESQHDKTNKMVCVPSKDSDQPGHPPSLIRVFAVRMKKAWILSYLLSAQQRLWSDWADAQADLMIWVFAGTGCFVGFVMLRLKCSVKAVDILTFFDILTSKSIERFTQIHTSMWASSWENLPYAICEQQKRRSACASSQSDQHLCFSLPR